MKMQYTTPSMKVMTVDLDATLLAGSIQAVDESGNNLEGLPGGQPTETGTTTSIEADSKSFSLWED